MATLTSTSLGFVTDLRSRFDIERDEKWREKMATIPFIRFPSTWLVQMTPPFGGAMVRFRVADGGEKEISVYLDMDDRLGCMGEPYWEIYPSGDGDTERFYMNDTQGLIAGIHRALKGEKTEDDGL